MSKTATAAKIAKPTPERRAKGPVELSAKTITDANGRIAQPYIGLDTLERMERSKAISKVEHIAGARFREDFRLAMLDPLHAMSINSGVKGGERVPVSETAERARRRVAAAMQLFGGRTTPAGSVIWAVVGEEKTLKDWSAGNPWIGEKAASGMLKCGLTVLAAHYGY